jgi:hypothetical protein
MKNLLTKIGNYFKRSEVIKTVTLSTGVTCVHTLDKDTGRVVITTLKDPLAIC